MAACSLSKSTVSSSEALAVFFTEVIGIASSLSFVNKVRGMEHAVAEPAGLSWSMNNTGNSWLLVLYV